MPRGIVPLGRRNPGGEASNPSTPAPPPRSPPLCCWSSVWMWASSCYSGPMLAHYKEWSSKCDLGHLCGSSVWDGDTWDRPGVPTPGLRSSLQALLTSLPPLSPLLVIQGLEPRQHVRRTGARSLWADQPWTLHLSNQAVLCGFLLGSAPCPQPGLWPWAAPECHLKGSGRT